MNEWKIVIEKDKPVSVYVSRDGVFKEIHGIGKSVTVLHNLLYLEVYANGFYIVCVYRGWVHRVKRIEYWVTDYGNFCGKVEVEV